jgi:hypothetical protein
MSTRAQSQYLRIYDATTTYARWQNYYVNQTITWQSESWTFFPFMADGSLSGPDESKLSIRIPATNIAAIQFNLAISNNYLCEFRMYEFDSRLLQTGPQASQSLIASYVGEIVDISGSFMEWTIFAGSSLVPAGAQLPPRKYTNKIVGTPIKI